MSTLMQPVDDDFEDDCEFFIPEPEVYVPDRRWSPAGFNDRPTFGLKDAWPVDLGDTGTGVTPAAGAADPPTFELDPDGYPGLHFGAGMQLTGLLATPAAISQTYIVFRQDAIGGHTHTLFALSNSIQVVITNTGILRIDGTTGDNNHPLLVAANQRYVAAVGIDLIAGTTTLDFLGTTQTVAGFTGATPDKYKMGADTAAYDDGWLYEIAMEDVVLHDPATRLAEMNRLRGRWGAI